MRKKKSTRRWKDLRWNLPIITSKPGKNTHITSKKMCKVKGLDQVMEISAEARRDLLLAYVGATTLTAARNYFYPQDLDTVKYEELKKGLKQMLKPLVTIFAARMTFEQLTRNEGETFLEFSTRLKEVSRHCDYAENLDERLRDRFVGGIRHEKAEMEIRERWPDGKEPSSKKKVTFQEVINLVVPIEGAEAEVRVMHEEDTAEEYDDSIK